MPHPDHVALLKQSISAWNTWRTDDPAAQPDLRGANLSGATLITTDLAGADLAGADLSEALLMGADLREAQLDEANLVGADLSEADLAGARLQEAMLGKTTFGNTNLTDTLGLETCIHWGPSTLDLGTLARSGDPLPVAFLQGCGLHDETIEDARLYRKGLSRDQREDLGYQIVHALPYLDDHGCFIAYARQDDAFARRLHADLQAHGIRCWFAPEPLAGGDRSRPTLDDAVRLRDKLLLILSKAALAGGYVAHEAACALSKERIDNRPILVPVRLDDAIGDVNEGWALPIKEDRSIVDFTDPARYASSFQRLVEHLKA